MKPAPSPAPSPLPALIKAAGGTCAVAALTGVSPRTITRWEANEFPCPPEVEAMIAAQAALRQGEPFHHRLRNARTRRGLSQAQVVAHISPLLSTRTLQAWEIGDKAPPEWAMDLLVRQVEALGGGEKKA